MKKVFLILCAVVGVALTATAQESKTMYVMKNGKVAYQSAVSEVDSIIFYAPEGANREEGTFPAVVSYNVKEKLPSILTVIGEFAAPDLASTDLKKGDCILTHFTLDWGNQPENSSIFHASNISYAFVNQNYAQVQSNFDETESILPIEDLLPIRSLAPFAYSPILDGKFFLHFLHSAPQRQDMRYIAIAVPNSETTPDDTVDLYLVAQKINYSGTPNMDIDNLHVIDIRNVIMALGKETTYREYSIEYRVKEPKIRIKYCAGFDEDDIPVYTLYQYNGQSIIPLSVFI